MTLRGADAWVGDVVILTVNVPHIESTSKFKFKLDMTADDAISHIKDTLKKRGFLFGADLDAPYTLLTLGRAAAARRGTGTLLSMKAGDRLADYSLETGDVLYFKPLFQPSAQTVLPTTARDSDADMDTGRTAAAPAVAAPRASFVKKAALPAPIGDGTIQHAAQQGDVARVRDVLLLSKLSPDTQDVHGNTALMWACARGHLDVVQLLLAHGAFVDLQSHSGATALLYGAKKSKLDCVRALLAAGANPNLRDESGASPVSLAAKAGSGELVHELLQHGADVCARDTTALLWAAKKGHIDIVRLLLASGADKMIATADGKRAIDLAQAGRHTAVADLLRAWGPELVRLTPSDIELEREDVPVQLEIRNYGAGVMVTIEGVDVPSTELRRAGDVVTVQILAPQSDFPCFRHIELSHSSGARTVAQRALRYGQPSLEQTAALRIGAFDLGAGYVPPPAPPPGAVPSRSAPSSPHAPQRSGGSAPPPLAPSPSALAAAAAPVALPSRSAPSSPRAPQRSVVAPAEPPEPMAQQPPRSGPLPAPRRPSGATSEASGAALSKAGSLPSMGPPLLRRSSPPRILPLSRSSVSVVQAPPEPQEPTREALLGLPSSSAPNSRRSSPMPDPPQQQQRRVSPVGEPPMPQRRGSPAVPLSGPPAPAVALRQSFAGAPSERSDSPLTSGGAAISKPTDVTRNRDAVKALLESAGVDASIVDRKPGSFISTSAAPLPSGSAASGSAAVAQLERTAQYGGGFSDTSATCVWFWDWLHGLSSMELSTLNHMLTGNALVTPSALRLVKCTAGAGVSVSDVGGKPTLLLAAFGSKAEMAESLKRAMLEAFSRAMK
jgi:hypothetical protein